MIHIADRVREIFIEQLNVSKDLVTSDAKLVESLDTDSMDVVELIVKFESEFDLEIPTESLSTIKTVKDVINFVKTNSDPELSLA